jgi:hypothetical protein
MSYVTSSALRENEAKSSDVAAAVRVARAIEPQKRKRDAAFYDVCGFGVRNAKDGNVRRTSAEESANVTARNGMLEVRRSS